MGSFSRPNFFTNQLLTADDLTAALEYHRDQMRRHCQSLFTPGVAAGMEISLLPSGDLSVSPGIAIDDRGQEIACDHPLILTRQEFPPELFGRVALLAAQYQEKDDPDSQLQGESGFRRKIIEPKLQLLRDNPSSDLVVLGAVSLDANGRASSPSFASRPVARAKVRLTLLKDRVSTNKVAGVPAIEMIESSDQDMAFQLVDVIPSDDQGVLSWTLRTRRVNSASGSSIQREVVISNSGTTPTGYRIRVFGLTGNT